MIATNPVPAGSERFGKAAWFPVRRSALVQVREFTNRSQLNVQKAAVAALVLPKATGVHCHVERTMTNFSGLHLSLLVKIVFALALTFGAVVSPIVASAEPCPTETCVVKK